MIRRRCCRGVLLNQIIVRQEPTVLSELRIGFFLLSSIFSYSVTILPCNEYSSSEYLLHDKILSL